MKRLSRVLPQPGTLWGGYPMRPGQDWVPPQREWRWRGALAWCQWVARLAQAHAAHFLQCAASEQADALPQVRGRLRRDGLQPQVLALALGYASASATRTLGLTARASQLSAAAALLDSRMAEMATGEGKTLAVGLAAAVAALAGIPVHVVTANDYLAARDARQLEPLYRALGLQVAALAGSVTEPARRAVYGHDIVYATARDLAFDFLRDRQLPDTTEDLPRAAAAVAGVAVRVPLMRGLCMALLDEADNILLDEAEVPLVLSRNVPQAARRAFLWQALALARQLQAGRDFTLHTADRLAVLTPQGEEALGLSCAGLGGPWQRPRYRREAVALALAALQVYHRDEHYLVRAGAIELLDLVSGRVASGRVWSRGLHTLVAMKEGLRPPAETETLAQTTFQRFFQRYWRLGGTSGTLREARAELHGVYAAVVVCIPLHQRSRRKRLPARVFAQPDAMFAAVADRVRALRADGRPVLVGTDSVADSQRLSELLHGQGIPHQVLNALFDAEEAAIVAQAGRAGAVTVATRMAGRGTDIELDAAARAAGGLHVLSCQRNVSLRQQRQLAGRGARNGDPGSSETWSCEGDSGPWDRWREEYRRRVLRRSLLDQDLYWERRLAFAGSAP